ncbi:hypothetical protein PHMEG_00013505 [Phytophthora megakarya]|uniref:Uncharacterized protein n=1 Tax=Phytophthora megakarya TaxID=4795 RepID=A0A225W669_9STRA|nr:hypothetical protein PHMEG_00013505 [Phytophthora megakarya]
MHMLFQSETTYRLRRTWMPRDGDDKISTTMVLAKRPKCGMVLLGPGRPRVRRKSRNCNTIKREVDTAKRRSQQQIKTETERHSEDKGNQEEKDHEQTMVGLRDEVLAMQMEIETLQRRRLVLDSVMVNARTNAVAKAIDLTKGFYVHFSNGFDPVKHPEQSRLAEAFLRGIMRNDAICTEFQGVDLFLNQYKISTENHASIRVFVHDIVVINEDLSKDGAIQVLAKATSHLRVSRATLEKFFPRIIDDEELVQQLIGKEYVIQYDKVFHFKQGRVFQHESQIDFCNSILEMTQNPFVAMKLLDASLMTKHGHFKVDNNIEEDMNQLENTVL